MGAYILRRLLLIPFTLFLIMAANFAIVQIAPGGPVEQQLAQITGQGSNATDRITGAGGDAVAPGVNQNGGNAAGGSNDSKYRGAQGLDPDLIAQIEKQFGFDKPAHERFFIMMWDYMTFDFGTSFFRDAKVVDIIIEKMSVSISLGLWTTLLVYLISIPLGVIKAVNDGSRFDVISSAVIIVGYAIPGFLFAILLIVLFSGGSYWDIFPLRGLVSDNFAELSTWGKVVDYFWHLTLPIISMVVGGFASLTMLTKNSFMDEIGKQYVMTARAKGLSEFRVLFGHVFRNAMLIVIAGFPAAFIGVLFTGSMLIEVIFSLDGLGLLGFEAVMKRDYPVMFGTMYMFTLMGLILSLIGDLMYVAVDPRIDFDKRSS